MSWFYIIYVKLETNFIVKLGTYVLLLFKMQKTTSTTSDTSGFIANGDQDKVMVRACTEKH